MTSLFQKELSRYKKKFDSLFLGYIPKTPKSLWQPVIYHFKSGGKRWRPFLVRVIAKMYRVPSLESLPLEAIVELTHNWTLIHDDIEDGDTLRRGSPTVWKKFGIDYGVNSGDAMFALSFKILKDSEKKWGRKNTLYVLEKFVEMLNLLTEGQNLEFDFRRKIGNIKTSDYLTMIKKKTAALPKFGLISIAKLGGARERAIKSLEVFCDNIFPAFQIRDDVLNLIGGKDCGEEVGGDIKEGKRTLPILHLMNNVSLRERNSLLKTLTKGRNRVASGEVKRVVGLMEEKKSIKYTFSFIEKLVIKGKEALFNIVPSRGRVILEEIASWLSQKRDF